MLAVELVRRKSARY